MHRREAAHNNINNNKCTEVKLPIILIIINAQK